MKHLIKTSLTLMIFILGNTACTYAFGFRGKEVPLRVNIEASGLAECIEAAIAETIIYYNEIYGGILYHQDYEFVCMEGIPYDDINLPNNVRLFYKNTLHKDWSKEMKSAYKENACVRFFNVFYSIINDEIEINVQYEGYRIYGKSHASTIGGGFRSFFRYSCERDKWILEKTIFWWI